MKYLLATIAQLVATCTLAYFFHYNISSYHYDFYSYITGLVAMWSFMFTVDLFEMYKKLK